MIKFCCLIGFLLVHISTFAVTGNQVLTTMVGKSNGDLYLETFTLGLLTQELAVRLNAKEAVAGGAKQYVVPFCIPQSSTVQQAAMILKNELLQKPENNHEEILLIIRRAFVAAWPCSIGELMK